MTAELVAAQAMNCRHAEHAAIRALMQRRFRSNQRKAGAPVDRLLEKVAFGATDCWHWIGHCDDAGYGRINLAGQNFAHRASYAVFVGPIPEGLRVLHKCDVRGCINPEHLFLGTQADNVQDMCSKGRNRTQPLYGSANPMSKLDRAAVDLIRQQAAIGIKQIDLANQYKVSPMTISRIVRRELWK
jgi:hypothetical protein